MLSMNVAVLLSFLALLMISLRFLLGLGGVIHTLCVGLQCILASSGVQQGYPLGPLLFSLVLMQFIDHVKLHDLVAFHIWYLDDGTFISSRSSLLQLMDTFTSHGP